MADKEKADKAAKIDNAKKQVISSRRAESDGKKMSDSLKASAVNQREAMSATT